MKIRGRWKYLYRAVDKTSDTVDFLLTAKQDRKAALRFLRRAIGQNGAPRKITIDKSGANTAAIESYNAECEVDIEIRRKKYLNNIVEQDHVFQVHGVDADGNVVVRRKLRRSEVIGFFVELPAALIGMEA